MTTQTSPASAGDNSHLHDVRLALAVAAYLARYMGLRGVGDAGCDLLGRTVACTTRLDLTAAWFLEQYARMFAFAAVVTFGLLLKVCLTGAPGVDGRPRSIEIVKSATVYYLYAVTAGGFAPAVVHVHAGGRRGWTERPRGRPR